MATQIISRQLESANQFEMVPTREYENLSHFSGKKTAHDISWSNVNFTVGEKTKVLSNCWGQVKTGQVCAIMGPSGAGKSSLLNVLAGRSSSAPGIKVEGTIRVGGHVINPVAFRKNIAYVMQDDALMPTATPREALRFSANLRLPSTMTSEEIETRVTTLLDYLGLSDCADVIIGGALIKGISGGQRKRASVGVEIITDPTLLFLDEPTSGLDSFSAFNLIKLLKVISQNCAILCTIHQPSSEVFLLFDIVVFMKDGRIFYQGPVDEIVPFYELRGRKCPENYNPGDFVMNLCQSEPVDVLESNNLFMEVPDQLSSEKAKSAILKSEMITFQSESGFVKQTLAVAYREWINFFRDAPALTARFGVTIVLNLIFGLIFLGAGSTDNGSDENFNSHVGAISMMIIFSLFGSGQSVLLAFPFERPMILREYVTGTYGITAYFISKVIVEAPVTFVQMLLQWIIGYFMIGCQGNFIYLVLASFGLGMVSNSIALGLGCLVPDVKDATELAPLNYMPQVLFAGFFIRTTQIPVFLRWAQYLCGMKYAMDLVFMAEFRVDSPSCNTNPQARQNCEQLLSENNIDTSVFYVYIIVLILIFLAFRVIGGLILHQKAKRFY